MCVATWITITSLLQAIHRIGDRAEALQLWAFPACACYPDTRCPISDSLLINMKKTEVLIMISLLFDDAEGLKFVCGLPELRSECT